MNPIPDRNEPRLRIAAQKSGRLADESIDLLGRCGLRFSRSRDRLFCYGSTLPVDLLLVRDDDIPGLLFNGVCDLGIVGLNVLEEALLDRNLETSLEQVEILARLNFGACRLSIAVPEQMPFDDVSDLADLRIATSYPNLTSRFLARSGVDARIVELSGSVEIAPALGTADAIADLVSTGATLRANHLREVEVIMESSAALVRMTDPLPAPREAILERLLPRVSGVIQVRESKYVMLHAPRKAIDSIREILPGAESPTILPLEGEEDRVALHAVCRETVFWEHLEELRELGATAVLVLPVEKMLA